MQEQPEFDLAQLDRELDRVKTHAFTHSCAAFLAPLMCYMEFRWDEAVGTAGVDGENFWWAPSYFSSLPPESRQTDLMHELWHVARMHIFRRGDRCPDIWNIACDIKIDLDLKAEGYTFDKIPTVLNDPKLNDPRFVSMCEEEIYDVLISDGRPPPEPPRQDLRPETTKEQQQKQLNAVMQAVHAAILAGEPGSIPGSTKEVLKNFLTPVVPWETVLHRFMEELLEHDYSWQVRDRRYLDDVYLPGEIVENGKLQNIHCYADVSGSVTEAQMTRFISEMKHIKDVYCPAKMKVSQFDTRITSVTEYGEEDTMDELVIIGRGGTNLEPVRQQIIKDRPTAVIIFSDLLCAPMGPLPFEVPIIWIAIANRTATVPYGELVHIKA